MARLPWEYRLLRIFIRTCQLARGVRLPTILGKAIDDVTRTLNDQSSEEKIVDLIHCIECMDVPHAGFVW